jgi:hypothetical protein
MTITATTTTQITLKPQVRRKLLTELKVYVELKEQREVLDLAMRTHRDSVENILLETGESSLALDGFKVTLVAPVRKVLDHKKLIALGVTTEQIQRATVEVPGKPYPKISWGGKNGDESE